MALAFLEHLTSPEISRAIRGMVEVMEHTQGEDPFAAIHGLDIADKHEFKFLTTQQGLGSKSNYAFTFLRDMQSLDTKMDKMLGSYVNGLWGERIGMAEAGMNTNHTGGGRISASSQIPSSCNKILNTGPGLSDLLFAGIQRDSKPLCSDATEAAQSEALDSESAKECEYKVCCGLWPVIDRFVRLPILIAIMPVLGLSCRSAMVYVSLPV
ncbi:hypothetical protein FIBSPDRAFT_887599 [Athelia psychrophila]|uniref:Uncharacterized protein n=1 Tax=Athelia psychrophila TaxID=1759441 RepID=A0A166PMG5_9AGAM|nr:hypothetical protein FIBSPDRAFT_887599 [Fibularhizoctonia sp. CBS 109695]